MVRGAKYCIDLLKSFKFKVVHAVLEINVVGAFMFKYKQLHISFICRNCFTF